MRDPHQNIFYYYRGPSKNKSYSLYDIQIEDNTTKALINILEHLHDVGFDGFLNLLLKKIGAPKRPVLLFGLQRAANESRPDGLINLTDYRVSIESKVQAKLSLDQLSRHIRSLSSQDRLLVITNKDSDRTELRHIKDRRVCYLSWSEVHGLCCDAAGMLKANKNMLGAYRLMLDFIDYLEVMVMTEFSGFKNEDFDFWIDYNPYYAPILKKKLDALATIIKMNLPKKIRKIYSITKVGNISHVVPDERHAWVAIKKLENKKDKFNQCNFTIEVSKSALDINAVIRNGKISDKAKPLGVLHNKLSQDPNGFIALIKDLSDDAYIVISKREPKTGTRIMPGNEVWESFFDMRLRDVTTAKDIEHLTDVLSKAKYPGVHIRYSIDRGSAILSKPLELQSKIIDVIKDFMPVLAYLEK